MYIYIISCKDTGVKKVQPNKVKSYMKVNTCGDHLQDLISECGQGLLVY